jgi:hypothetical protein
MVKRMFNLNYREMFLSTNYQVLPDGQKVNEMRKRVRANGQVIAEAPAVLMMLFMGFVFPLIGICVFGCRAAFMYYCVRDVCYQAATSISFSQAQINGNTEWTKDLVAWPGVTSAGNPTYLILITNPTTGTTTTSASSLTTVNTETYIYFIQATATGNIQPLLGTGWTLLGAQIPGLNQPFQLQMTQQIYVENPNGLTQ